LIRIHDLRHTYARLEIANGEDIKAVSETLGHKDIDITLLVDRHVMPKELEDMAEHIENMMMGG
jgi:integrase